MSSPPDLALRYQGYLAAFNVRDFDMWAEYVDENVYFDWRGRMPDLVGRDAMFGFYRKAFEYLTERLTARNVRIEGDRLTADVENRLNVFREWPDGPLGPMPVGERIMTGDICYTWSAGRIVHII